MDGSGILAQGSLPALGNSLLAVASAILVLVSIAWLLLFRHVLRLLNAGLPRRRASRDIWRDPPLPRRELRM